MKTQNSKNYRKYYPLHHFLVLPASLVLFIFSLSRLWNNMNTTDEFFWIWSALSVGSVLLLVISVMLRQHYALGLQDRIIINEFKFRYFTLTSKRLEEAAYHFSDAQIFALRFSQDQDLVGLMDKTAENDWSAAQIKENIKNWKADNRRV